MLLRRLWSLIGRQVTTNNTQKECVYSINRINIVQDYDLIHNCVKQFCEYGECINGENQEIAMSMNDMNCLKKSTKEAKFTNGKYKAPILWKKACKELPENYQTTTVKVIAKKIGKKRAIQNVPKSHRHMSHKVAQGK